MSSTSTPLMAGPLSSSYFNFVDANRCALGYVDVFGNYQKFAGSS
jgi:hypothetical protein